MPLPGGSSTRCSSGASHRGSTGPPAGPAPRKRSGHRLQQGASAQRRWPRSSPNHGCDGASAMCRWSTRLHIGRPAAAPSGLHPYPVCRHTTEPFQPDSPHGGRSDTRARQRPAVGGSGQLQAVSRVSRWAMVSLSGVGRWYASCLNSSACNCNSVFQAALSMLVTVANCSGENLSPFQFNSS